jgi:type II secretory pathway component HofQ
MRGLSLVLLLLMPGIALAQEGGPIIERLELKEARVDDAFRLLSELSGRNVLVTPAAGEATLRGLLLRDVPFDRAVEAICKTHQLWFRGEGALLRVMTAEEFQRDLRVVREPKTKVFSLLHPNPVAVAGAIRDLYGSRVLLSLGTSERDAIGSRLGGRGGASTSFRGSGNRSFSQGFQGNQGAGQTNALSTGSQTGPDASEELREGVSAERLAQVQESEGRVTSDVAGLTQGRPRISVTVNRRHNLVVVRTADEEALAGIERLVEELDRPTPQVLLELKILEVRLGDGQSSVLDVDYVAGPSRNDLPTNKGANPFVNGAASVLEQVAGAGNFPVSGGTLVYQFLNEHVRVRLQMLANEDRLAVLATPLLLCANDEVSRLFVGEERPLVRNFELQTTTTNGVVTNQVVPTVDLRDIGNTLRVHPRINADRTVTLTILQDVSSVNRGGATLPVPAGGGGVTTFSVDTVTTANLEATLIAKDGLTMAVGGLIRKEQVDRRRGIPYLMDLPLVGWLFGEAVRSTERRELILLITPHVLMTPAEGKERSEARLKALSLHPFHDVGDRALSHYDLDDVPGSSDYHLLVEDYLVPSTEPIR